MTEINPCNWLQNAGETHTAAQMRVGIGSLVPGASTTTSLNPRGGVNPSLADGMEVTQTSFGLMSVTIGSGVVHVPGSLSSTQGSYICINNGSVVRTIQASDGSNDRIDAVIARVYDSFYSGASNTWAIEVVTGTAESEPETPDLPDNSILLAEVLVEAGTSNILNADITDRRPFLPGGIIPVHNTADRDALLNPYSGMPVWVMINNHLDIWNGSRYVSLTRGAVRVLITSNTTFTKATYPWARKFYIQVQGAGGGGGGSASTTGQSTHTSAGSGGGGGAYADRILTYEELPSSVSVVVGTGGNGGTAGNAGSSGGNSVFTGFVTCGGGGGGNTSPSDSSALNVRGGLGGTVSGGFINLPGGDGGIGHRRIAPEVSAGWGGSSFLSGGPTRETSNQGGEDRNGIAGKLYGGGGSGAYTVGSSTGATGGNGANGVVIVTVI